MPFSADELALIEAIHADPRNDVPRLAYAAWLEADGDPLHAEFIRLQCREPYIATSNRYPSKPSQSFSFDFPYDDPTAGDRLARLLEIFPTLYGAERYAAQRNLEYYEEHYRGLPLVHVGDESFPEDIDGVLERIGHLSRVDLTLRTDRLAEMLAHPLMDRVDKLHIWPEPPWDAERDADCTMNSHHDRFWAENIPVLAASPLIDRLIELNPCGLHSTGVLTGQSRKNMDLCRELLEPRVCVEYNY